jgi:hypothetical protein
MHRESGNERHCILEDCRSWWYRLRLSHRRAVIRSKPVHLGFPGNAPAGPDVLGKDDIGLGFVNDATRRLSDIQTGSRSFGPASRMPSDESICLHRVPQTSRRRLAADGLLLAFSEHLSGGGGRFRRPAILRQVAAGIYRAASNLALVRRAVVQTTSARNATGVQIM